MGIGLRVMYTGKPQPPQTFKPAGPPAWVRAELAMQPLSGLEIVRAGCATPSGSGAALEMCAPRARLGRLDARSCLGGDAALRFPRASDASRLPEVFLAPHQEARLGRPSSGANARPHTKRAAPS